MYHTYDRPRADAEDCIDYEEELIPRDIENKKDTSKKITPSKSKNIFEGVLTDDLIIILILIMLMNENCEDKTFISILLILLFL